MLTRVASVFGPDAERILTSPHTLVVFLTSLLMMMNVEMISPLLPVLMDEYLVSESRIGLVMTALTLPPVFTIPFVGVAADRFSRRYVLSGSLLLVGVGGIAIPLTTTFDQLLALRALQGVGYGGVMPTTVALLGDLYDGTAETTAQGVRTFFNNVTAAVMPAVGGLLLVVSWEAPFALYAINIPAALLVLVAVPTRPSTRHERDDDDSYTDQLVGVLAQREVLLVFAAGFTAFFIRYGFVTYLPLLLVREFGMRSNETGLLVGLGAGCAAIGASQAGRLSDWFSKTRTVQLGLLGSGGALAALPFTASVPFAVTVATVVCYGFFWGATAPTQRSLVNHLSTAQVRASAVSASHTVVNLGKATAPVATGLAISVAGYGVGFASLGLLPALTAIGFHYYRPVEE